MGPRHRPPTRPKNVSITSPLLVRRLINLTVEVELHPIQVDEPPPPIPVAELSEANEVSTTTEVSAYQDGAARSNESAVSAEDTSQHPMSVQENSVNDSQPWSDDANNTSQPTSLEQVQHTPDDSYVNGSAFAQGLDFTKDTRPDSHENGAGGHKYDESNGNQQDTQPPEARSQQYSAPASARHSSSESLTIPHLPSISEHLLQLSTSKMWADWALMIHTTGIQPFAVYAHGLVLMRSTRLTTLMNRQAASQYNDNVVNLHPPRIIVPHAFEAALRFFYSDTVLSSEILSPKQPISDLPKMRTSLLDYLVSYWVSGIELGVEPIVTRSAHLLVEFMDWDVTEAIMKEATELDSISWRAGDQGAGVALDYAAMALQLKQTMLNFAASRIDPAEFKLDASGSASIVRSRFAQIEDNRARHKPALASMVFGSMPSSADLSPSSPQSEILPIMASVEEQELSNILLNLEFDELAFFYRQLEASHGATAPRLMAKVVEERESRRMKVVSNRGVPNKQRMTNSEIWEVAGFREVIEVGAFRRERVGFLLPTKTR